MKYSPKDGFPYYQQLAGDSDCFMLFSSLTNFNFLHSIPEEKASYRYAPGKWSIKQVVGHITDHERIKMARAFFLSRQQPVELWGYDQVSLVNNSRFDALSYTDLLTDLENVRRASISFISALSDDQLQLKGMAKGYEITLAQFLQSIIGHEIHHINVIREKYL